MQNYSRKKVKERSDLVRSRFECKSRMGWDCGRQATAKDKKLLVKWGTVSFPKKGPFVKRKSPVTRH
jgi:hypothetical protein